MPRIDRVIVALTENPTYTGFWNYVAEIWHTKFHVKPTLMFYGSDTEFTACRRRSTGRGELVHLPRVEAVTLNRNREWACTWGLFYGAAQYPDEVCMLTGIDQIPLGGAFFDRVKAFPASDYIVSFADHNGNPTARATTFPSSHHIGLGRRFQEIFEINPNWPTEVQKVFAARTRYRLEPDGWGLDEAYSSEILHNKPEGVRLLTNFVRLFAPLRLDRSQTKITQFDFNAIRSGRYAEWHADRPFEANDPAALARLAQNIPDYAW